MKLKLKPSYLNLIRPHGDRFYVTTEVAVSILADFKGVDRSSALPSRGHGGGSSSNDDAKRVTSMEFIH